MPRWFISHQGFKESAFDEAEFQAIVKRGVLPPTAAVRREDSQIWRELRAVLAEQEPYKPIRPPTLSGPIPVVEEPEAAARPLRERNVPARRGSDSQFAPRRGSTAMLMLSGAMILASGVAIGWFAHADWKQILSDRTSNTMMLAEKSAARPTPTHVCNCTWCGSGMASTNHQVVSCNGVLRIAENMCGQRCLDEWTRANSRGRGFEGLRVE